MIQILKSVFKRFFKKKAQNIFEISKRKPVNKENENTLQTDNSIVIEGAQFTFLITNIILRDGLIYNLILLFNKLCQYLQFKKIAKEVKQQFKCRICLDQGETPDSAVCMPCKCSGSMKYVHVECLQAWIIQKKSLKCEICNFDYSIKWFNWAAQHNILEPAAQKKSQSSSNNNANQRRQQSQNQQNRIRQQQNLLRTFGQRKNLSILQKIQCLLLIAGITVSFAFAYQSNYGQDWQSSKDSNQHKRVFFTSLITYFFTVIIAYFWISQSKGFEYTFETNLNYFKTHLPTLQNNNLINLQQQQNEEDNSNSEIDIEAQQPIQQQPVVNLASISMNLQQDQQEQDLEGGANISNIIQNNALEERNQNLNQLEEIQQEESQIQNEAKQEINIEIQVKQQGIQGGISLQNVEVVQDQPPQNSQIREKQSIGVQESHQNNENPIEAIESVDQITNQVVKFVGIAVTTANQIENETKSIKDALKSTSEIQNDIPQQDLYGVNGLACFNLKIDDQQKIILFGESDSCEDNLDDQLNQNSFKRETQKIQYEKLIIEQQKNDPNGETQDRQTIKDGEENIPSTFRQKDIDEDLSKIINNREWILKHKKQPNTDNKNKQGTIQILDLDSDLSERSSNYEESQTKNQYMAYPKIVVHTDSQIQSYQESEFISYIIKSSNDLPQKESDPSPNFPKNKDSVQDQILQQEQQEPENQIVELIKFDSNESMNEEDEENTVNNRKHEIVQIGILETSINEKEEDIITSPKSKEKQSYRKEDHSKILKPEWNEYMQDDVSINKQDQQQTTQSFQQLRLSEAEEENKIKNENKNKSSDTIQNQENNS